MRERAYLLPMAVCSHLVPEIFLRSYCLVLIRSLSKGYR